MKYRIYKLLQYIKYKLKLDRIYCYFKRFKYNIYERVLNLKCKFQGIDIYQPKLCNLDYEDVIFTKNDYYYPYGECFDVELKSKDCNKNKHFDVLISYLNKKQNKELYNSYSNFGGREYDGFRQKLLQTINEVESKTKDINFYNTIKQELINKMNKEIEKIKNPELTKRREYYKFPKPDIDKEIEQIKLEYSYLV